jgi:hypothetical protein
VLLRNSLSYGSTVAAAIAVVTFTGALLPVPPASG